MGVEIKSKKNANKVLDSNLILQYLIHPDPMRDNIIPISGDHLFSYIQEPCIQ
jgi:hypothetical protein